MSFETNPLLSIITVVYNAEKTLEQTILSVINQKKIYIEFIIIDGDSTDGTKAIIEKYKSYFHYYLSERDKGIYDAMNKGIKIATGDYIYFLGADDILVDENVLKIMSLSLINPKFVYYGDVIFKTRKLKYDGKFNSLKIVTRNICQQGVFYPRELFKYFQYNLEYKIMADYDLNIRAYFSNIFKFKYVPLTVAIFNDLGLSGSTGYDETFEKHKLEIIKTHCPVYVYWYRKIRNFASKVK